MKNYLKHVENLKGKIDAFCAAHSPGEAVLLLDGTGMLSSYQNTILSLIGTSRLDQFQEVHLVSGSAYSLFIFLAMRSGDFRWRPDDISRWNNTIHKWHGVTPVLSFLKFMTHGYFGWSAGRFGGHYTVCKEIFGEAFSNRRLATFSNKYRFWVFNATSGKFEFLNSESEYGALTVSDAISMATSIPSVFGYHAHQGSRYMDAMYAPGYSKLKYSLFEGRPVLHLNMHKEGQSGGLTSLKIHDHADGNTLVRRDFNRLLLGFRNPEFDQVTRFALFEAGRA